MIRKLDKISIVTDNKHIQIREKDEKNENWRRVLTPEMDYSKEVKKIQEHAEENWTNKVKQNWKEHQQKDQHYIMSRAEKS